MARGRGRVAYDFLRGSYATRKLHCKLNASACRLNRILSSGTNVAHCAAHTRGVQKHAQMVVVDSGLDRHRRIAGDRVQPPSIRKCSVGPADARSVAGRPDGGVRFRVTDRDRVPRPERHARARKGQRTDQARGERRRDGHRARSWSEPELGARAAQHRAPPGFPNQPRRLSLLDVPQHRGAAGPVRSR